jgi:solute carrier family 25 phosphate transporter 3
MIGGALACGLTHTAVVSLDIVKCNMQANPAEYKSLPQGLGLLKRTQGFAGMTKGWLPTLIGYNLQGLFKFGLNEVFKDTYANFAGEEGSKKYRVLIWAAASGSAEFFADIALCPFEMVKIKVQTDASYPMGMGAAWSKISADKAQTKFPLGSLKPLWSRQIPYTIAKFVGFEACVEYFYKNVFTADRNSYSKAQQLGITFMSGYIAGVFCALISQPADNLVSQMGKQQNAGKSFGQMASEQGMKNLFLKGLGTRILMIGTLTGLQWWIYDTYKTINGLGTSGGASVAKK